MCDGLRAVLALLVWAAPGLAETVEIYADDCNMTTLAYSDEHPGMEIGRRAAMRGTRFECKLSAGDLDCKVSNELAGLAENVKLELVAKERESGKPPFGHERVRLEGQSPSGGRFIVTLNLQSGRAVTHYYSPSLTTYLDDICAGEVRLIEPRGPE